MTGDEIQLLRQAATKAQALAEELSRQAKSLDSMKTREGHRRLDVAATAAVELAGRLSPAPSERRSDDRF